MLSYISENAIKPFVHNQSTHLLYQYRHNEIGPKSSPCGNSFIVLVYRTIDFV